MPGEAMLTFPVGDELAERRGWKSGVDHEHHGETNHPRDRCDIADEIEIEFLVERRIDGVGRDDGQQRVAVGRGAHHRLGGNIAAGAGPAFHHKGLVQMLRQPLPDQTRDQIRRAAAAQAFNDAHRPGRIIVGVSETPCRRRERGGTR